jgi:hypothetical protein
LPDQEDEEGVAEERGHDQRQVGPIPSDVEEHEELRDHQNLPRDEQRDDEQVEQELSTSEAEPGERVGDERAGEEGSDDVPAHDHERVQRVPEERLVGPPKRTAEVLPMPELGREPLGREREHGCVVGFERDGDHPTQRQDDHGAQRQEYRIEEDEPGDPPHLVLAAPLWPRPFGLHTRDGPGLHAYAPSDS